MFTGYYSKKLSSKQKYSKKLSSEQNKLIADLATIGAATPRQLEIRTNRIGLDVRNKLQPLLRRGYVKRSTYIGGSENEIFTPSPKGYRMLAEIQPHMNKPSKSSHASAST